MIRYEESGLTGAELAQFRELTGPYAYQLEAFQWNPDFSLFATGIHSVTGDVWSVAQAGQYVFKITGNSGAGEDTVYLDRFNLTTGTWTNILWDVPILHEEPARIHYDATLGRISIYVHGPYGLFRKWSDDNGASWTSNDGGDWENICGDYLKSYRYNPTKIASATVIYSTYLGASYEPWRAFDSDTPVYINNVAVSDTFWAANTSTGWIGQDYGAGVTKTVVRYRVRARATNEFVSQNPKSWTLQYSDNGSTWTTVHTVTDEPAWQPCEWRSYQAWNFSANPSVPSYGAHRYWRLNFTANHGDAVLSVGEIEFFDYTSEYDSEVKDCVPMGWDKVLVSFMNRQKENYDLRLYSYSGGVWTSDADSVIGGYNYPISTLQGVQVNSTDWYLVTSAETPGPVSIVSEHGGIGKYYLAQGGLIGWSYHNETLSDHIEIDVLDKLTDWRFRSYPRLNRFSNGRYYLTAYSSDGTETLPFTAYRLYTSDDGLYWSAGDIINLPDGAPTTGIFLAETTNHVYAFTRDGVYRSPKTLAFGTPAASTTIDLTDRVQDIEIASDGVTSVNFTLNNDDGLFDDHAIVSTAHTVYFKLKMGFWVDDGAGGLKKLLIPVATTIMDAAVVDHGEGPPAPKFMYQITSRDVLSRMTDFTTSETAHYWKSQIVGLDTYEESIDSYYGGLSHTATQSGSHQTTNGVLETIHSSASEEVCAFSTYNADLWNGVVEVAFNIPSAGTKAGLVFHAADGDNYMLLVYNQATDKLELHRREGGLTTWSNFLSGQPSLSWTATGTWRYLRLQMDYGTISAWTSNDGITWTNRVDRLAEEYITRTPAYSRPVSSAPFDRGFAGVYATGATTPVQFDNFRIYDNGRTQNVEEAIRAIVNFSGIHDFWFTNALGPVGVSEFSNSAPATFTVTAEIVEVDWDESGVLWDTGYEWS